MKRPHLVLVVHPFSRLLLEPPWPRREEKDCQLQLLEQLERLSNLRQGQYREALRQTCLRDQRFS
jgi:hypothetical protein